MQRFTSPTFPIGVSVRGTGTAESVPHRVPCTMHLAPDEFHEADHTSQELRRGSRSTGRVAGLLRRDLARIETPGLDALKALEMIERRHHCLLGVFDPP